MPGVAIGGWSLAGTKRIVEAETIKALTRQGFVVIGAGGGGIPCMVRSAQGDYQSVDAVIDRISTALLAREIHADIGHHHRR